MKGLRVLIAFPLWATILDFFKGLMPKKKAPSFTQSNLYDFNNEVDEDDRQEEWGV